MHKNINQDSLNIKRLITTNEMKYNISSKVYYLTHNDLKDSYKTKKKYLFLKR